MSKIDVFEPHKIKSVKITNAKDYWKYFLIKLEEGKVWHIVGQAYSIMQVWGEVLLKIYPFEALPILLKVEKKEDISFVRSKKSWIE